MAITSAPQQSLQPLCGGPLNNVAVVEIELMEFPLSLTKVRPNLADILESEQAV